ncbi:2OG-Fe dioxygenase family protein [Streptomyces sp. NBC_01803]|uniref:2OG-Fe dioxygenase family protein n=1 Tax=Streptomyces sp. NBC_01803 TaxID=2975946 RepID=UPI002DD95F6F|nr:2OG-Fe dioxygenase family protein [Streptomyces sp. NBC_01803]WSA47330.1 2OG-Fe dioxygenase family protein [Streptomyces sp. NBC_01803]
MPDDEFDPARLVTKDVARKLSEEGWVFVPGERIALAGEASAFQAESHSTWEGLPADPYTSAGTGRYRRYSRWVWEGTSRASGLGGTLLAARHLPYHQAPEINPLVGGVHRTFPPLPESVRDSALLRTLLRFDLAAAGAGPGRWEVDVHMVRIVPGPGGLGQPAPEGVHKDGLDVVAIHLVELRGLEGGVSSVFDDFGQERGRVRLESCLDSLLVDDRRLTHFTTPVVRSARGADGSPVQAWRDVLLVGLRRSENGERPARRS